MSEDCSITFNCLRVITNRHIYGPLHGLPLDVIQLDTRKTFPETSALVEMSVRPRIIEDELFLSTTYKILHPEENARDLRKRINKTEWCVCRHLQIGDYFTRENCCGYNIEFLPYRIPELKT